MGQGGIWLFKERTLLSWDAVPAPQVVLELVSLARDARVLEGPDVHIPYRI